VAFLITDIEASTQRWQQDEQQMSRALGAHDETLRSLVADHDGVVFKHTGDGVCAAFATVQQAAAAALDAQPTLELPVRVGLHVGTAELRDGDYYGTTVNVTARIAGLAQAGQILVSDAVAALLGDADIVDVGVHHLRGLSRPLRLFQLGPGTFPAIAPSGGPAGNIPVELDAFIGRDAQLDDLIAAVVENRVTTLLGAGGSGKTRLAVEAAHRVADEQPDGCWFVELSSISDEASVATAFASGLGIRLGPLGDSTERIVSSLATRRSLVIVDNCEHVLDAAARLIDAIVRRCHDVHVLATSREPLQLIGERLVPVGALSDADAVELFLVRAQAAAPDAEHDARSLGVVGSICERLDRMPLAIELAASRSRAFSPSQLAALLDERFRLLVGGVRRARVGHHQTMRATLDWSYELCNIDEQTVFDTVSVFPTSFDLNAARAVVADGPIGAWDVVDIVSRLVDRSLLEHEVDSDGASRYRLLETMRAYGREHLMQTGQWDAARGRHADHIKTIMIATAPRTYGPDERSARRVLERLVPDRYAAFTWFLERHDWDGAYCAADPMLVHDVRPEQEMVLSLRDAMLASGEELPDWFASVSLFCDVFTRRPEEMIWSAWAALDRSPRWSPDRWYPTFPYWLIGPNIAHRSTDDLLAALEITAASNLVVMRHLAEMGVVLTLIAWNELQLAEEHLNRNAPGWIESGSGTGRTRAAAIRAKLNAARGQWDDAARLLDEALSTQPLDEWHWSDFLLADERLVARVRAAATVNQRDLIEPWEARQSSGHDLAMPRAGLVTAFALDHLDAAALAKQFKRLLADVPPEQIAEDRASLRIPDDYELEVPPGGTPRLADFLDELHEFNPEMSDISIR
jgi:predicted ATPase